MVVGEFTQETDVVVIGGGPAGYACAFRAAELGVKVVIVDAHPSGALGGVCLHDGCVPSKTLLHVAETMNLASDAEAMGVKYAQPKIDLKAVKAWRDGAIRKLSAGLDSVSRRHAVERLQGAAHFEDARNVAIVGGTVPRVRFRRAVIATGSRPLPHDLLPFDHECVWTAEQAVQLSADGSIPKSLLVVGSDYRAVEIASIYAALGSDVTMVDEAERLLPMADADLVRPLDRRLDDRFKHIAMDVRVESAKFEKSVVKVTFAGEGAPASAKFDRVVVCGTQAANTHELGLAKTGVTVDESGFIKVNEQMRTDDQRVFAAGDVTGWPLLADKALQQGRICGEVLAGWGSHYDARVVPMTVFTDPQLAWCGLTESQAQEQDIPHRVARIPWGASGRAVGMGRSEGVTKVIFDADTQLVLGVGLCGPHACEMISEAALAIEMGAVLHDLAATIHPHPTISELLSDVARMNEGK